MESKKDFSSETDKDETLVTPRFDSDEAETARPVVPLAVVSGEAETYDVSAAAGTPPRAARRASLPLALVLVSALAGSVLGGAGLYLFQKSRQQQAASTTQTEQASGASEAAAGQTNAAPAAETTPAPSPTHEEASALAAELPAEVVEVPVAAEVPDEKEDRKDREDADRKRDDAKREDDDDAAPRGERVSAPAHEKRGKKGERDGDNYRARESRPRRVEDDSTDDEEYYDRGGARRIGSIVYERQARRERRRQRRQPAVDRVRGIFEGQP